jgi:hypothetical protein
MPEVVGYGFSPRLAAIFRMAPSRIRRLQVLIMGHVCLVMEWCLKANSRLAASLQSGAGVSPAKVERLPESLSECDRRSLGGIGDPASSGRDRRSTEITDLGYNCGVFLRFLFGNRSRASDRSFCSPGDSSHEFGMTIPLVISTERRNLTESASARTLVKHYSLVVVRGKHYQLT